MSGFMPYMKPHQQSSYEKRSPYYIFHRKKCEMRLMKKGFNPYFYRSGHTATVDFILERECLFYFKVLRYHLFHNICYVQ